MAIQYQNTILSLSAQRAFLRLAPSTDDSEATYKLIVDM